MQIYRKVKPADTYLMVDLATGGDTGGDTGGATGGTTECATGCGDLTSNSCNDSVHYINDNFSWYFFKNEKFHIVSPFGGVQAVQMHRCKRTMVRNLLHA
jgi:hypothetical protein